MFVEEIIVAMSENTETNGSIDQKEIEIIIGFVGATEKKAIFFGALYLGEKEEMKPVTAMTLFACVSPIQAESVQLK